MFAVSLFRGFSSGPQTQGAGMMIKRQVFGLAALLWMITGIGRCAEPILIVQPDSGAQQKGAPTLDFAAQELSRYLKTITDRDFPVVRGTDRNASTAMRLIVYPVSLIALSNGDRNTAAEHFKRCLTMDVNSHRFWMQTFIKQMERCRSWPRGNYRVQQEAR
jgi:hypothetical protein